MNKSLKDVAKAILKKEPLTEETSNAATLKPGSKFKEAMPKLSSNPSDVPAPAADELGTGPVKVGDDNPKDTGTSKDTSKSSGKGDGESFGAGKGNTPPKVANASTDHAPSENDGEKFGLGKEKPKQVNEDEEISEEDELTEEEAAIIDEMIEAGLTEEEIIAEMNKLYEEANEEDDEEDDEKSDEEKEEDKEEEKVEEEMEIDVSEDVKAMFEGSDDLSEEFKEKAKTIFEAAVKANIAKYQAKLDEDFATAINEAVEEIKETLSENVDNYLNYVVENWVKDNEVAIESSLRTELTEDFITGLRNLCAEHYIDIPEEKVDLVEELTQKYQELEQKLNEEIENNVQLTAQLNESTKFEIFVDEVDGLADTQIEKMKSLVENVEFVDSEDFRKKVKTLRENYFPEDTKKSVNTLTEADESNKEEETEAVGPMSAYVKTLKNTLPR